MKNILFLLLTFLLIVPDVYGFEYRIGTSYERMDPELSAIRDLNSDENKLPYYTGSGTASLADLTSFARTILDDADAATVRSTLGLAIGSDVQAYDADLTTYAGITPSANVQSLLDAADYAAIRALLDLEAGTDFYSISAADAAFEGKLDNSAGLAAALSDETGTGAAVFATSPTLVTPALGTIASGVGTALTALNGENIQDDTIDDDSIDFTDVTLDDLTFDVGSVSKTEFSYLNNVTSAIQTQLDAKEGTLTNSAGLASALSDETGTGAAVFATSPTLVTPALGTIASGVGTALTALNGENIQDDTIDDDSIDLTDVTLADFTDDIGAQKRLTQGVTIQTFTAADATPDVSNGGTSVVQLWRSVDTTTITDFDDGDDHSEFADGDSFILLFNSAQVIDCSDNANIKGHGNNDYTGAAGEWALFVWDDTNNYWVFKPGETKSANFTTLRVPNDESSDAVLSNLGEVHVRGDEDSFNLHFGTGGEIAGEATISGLEHIAVTFDPSWAYDQESTYRSVPLFKVGDDAKNGITLVEWKVNYVGGDPTTELDMDLICDSTPDYNTAAGATVMDVLDTTTGASNADSGFDSATCTNGCNMYFHFGSDPTDDNVMITVDLWFYREAD